VQQAECRILLIGQLRPCDIYYFLGRDSAEARVYKIAQSKKELAEDIAYQRDFNLGMKEMELDTGHV
jgi:SNF2 family DNA or RNA helicase